MTDNGNPNPAAVEREIDRTRAELAVTLDAIERKLNARHLVEKGLDMFRDNLGNDALLGMVRANPLPFAVMGIGAAWLVINQTQLADKIAEDERVAAARRRVAGMASGVGEFASDMAGRVGIGASSENRALGHTGNPMVDATAGGKSDGWVHQAAGGAQGALRSVRESSSAMITRAGDYAGAGVDRIGDTLQRHPLMFGAIGVLAGALIASLIPLTRREQDLLGDTREQIWKQAETAGREAVSRVRETAARTASKAVEAATEATSSTLKEEIDRAARG